MATEYTPARERSRHDALIQRLRRAPLGRPAWVLCPRESVARRLLDGVAQAGGGFVRVLGWSGLADALDDALGLPAVPAPSETERARSVERALAALPALAAPLGSDPFGVALGLLSVVDTLRLHGWDGVDPGSAPETPADALLAVHLGQLGAVLRAVESDLEARGHCDVIARLVRLAEALPRAGDGPGETTDPLPFTSLTVEGIDRLAPRERAVLAALVARGVDVDIAPWVAGWTLDAPMDTTAGATMDALTDAPATWLAALGQGEGAPGADGSVATVVVRDPHDEAETVARWVAEAVARGMDPETVAVAVSPEPGAAQRVARALARYGVPSHGGGASPVQMWPLWQVVRASVRLGWRGVDVVDLATVLSAPGSGVWGSDRDWLCAQLRRAVPTGWKGVREVLLRATADPAAASRDAPDPADDEEGAPVTVLELDTDLARVAQLAEIRERVEELVTLWESAGPFVRVAPGDRAAALRGVVEATLARFVNPVKFREGLADERVAGAWVAAAGAIDAACRAALDRVDATGGALPPHDPGAFLALAEPLLGVVPDGVDARRGDGVALLADEPFPARRPRVLLVTGFHRGRYPVGIGRALLLGPLERERLASAGGALAALPDEAAHGAQALRETARMLSLPSERLVLLWPRRRADGGVAEASLAWRDLLALLSPEARGARETLGFVPGPRWLAEEHPGAALTHRARVLDAVAALGAGRVAEAVALGAPLAAAEVGVRDLFMARYKPDRRFDVGDLVRDQVAVAVFTPRALETLLTCRYSFLTGHLLGLRPLRLARAPSLTAGDRAKVTRAALRSLDSVAAEGRAPTAADIEAALATAVTAHVPWADRGDMRFALEELQRTVRTFVRRYLDLRTAWNLDPVSYPTGDTGDTGDAGDTGGATGEKTDGETPTGSVALSLALPGGRAVRLVAQAPRVETHTEKDGAHALVMDLRLGSTDGFPKLRDAGLDLDSALVPAVAAARAGGEVAAFVRLSLSKPEGEALAGPEADAPFARTLSTTVVTVDRAHPLASHRERVLASLGATFDALMDDEDPGGTGALYAPHDEARAQELAQAGAKSCEYCGMRLGCRFRMAGGQ